jgi:hypothetical protein
MGAVRRQKIVLCYQKVEQANLPAIAQPEISTHSGCCDDAMILTARRKIAGSAPP